MNEKLYQLYKRRIACVIHYFDEEFQIPWDYVLRTTDGRFEAIVTLLLDDRAHEKSLGIFDDCQAAINAVGDWLHRVREAEHSDWRKPDGTLDFNRPTRH